jgi:recombinational DNA repair ATPase RecF
VNKIEKFQITGMTISGFKSYEKPTELVFGNPTAITGGNGRGKTSIADAIAFAVTGLPFFGERGLDRLHNEANPDVYVQMRFVDENSTPHELTRTRQKNRMTIHYDGYEIRQMDLSDLFGEKDVFLSIFNPLYFIEELGDTGKSLLEMYLPRVSQEEVLTQLTEPVRRHLEKEEILSPEAYLCHRQ